LAKPDVGAPAARPPVLILAPLGADAVAIERHVEACGLFTRACRDAAALDAVLAAEGPTGALFVVVSEEGAGPQAGRALARAFAREPDWAQLPVVFLIADSRRPPPAVRMLDRKEHAARFIVLERPARPTVLRHVFEAQAEARRRQFGTLALLERLRRAERRQTFLLKELRHRTRNSLAVLQAVFRLSARRAPSLDALIDSFGSRLRNLADAHERLAEAGGEACELERLLREHVAPYATSSEQLATAGPPVLIPADVAFDLAMVLHELATNAAKHGALSATAGRVEVSWRIDEADGAVDLLWRERDGPAVAPPSRHGLGIRLIERFSAHGAKAEVGFEREGLIWRARLTALAEGAARRDHPVPGLDEDHGSAPPRAAPES